MSEPDALLAGGMMIKTVEMYQAMLKQCQQMRRICPIPGSGTAADNEWAKKYFSQNYCLAWLPRMTPERENIGRLIMAASAPI